MSKLPQYLGYFCIIIATLTLSSTFANADFFVGSVVMVIVSIGWGIALWKNLSFVSILCLLIFVLGISLSVILQGSRLLLLVSLLTTLSAWDLGDFTIRISTGGDISNSKNLIRSHFVRLTSVLIFSLTLSLLAFRFQFDLKFWQVFLLGILLLAGLSQVFAQLKRSNIN